MGTSAIYLVANRRSEREFANLVLSIRKSGCQLPIVLIPFGGEAVQDRTALENVEVMEPSAFPAEGRDFVEALSKTLTFCPPGFLRRFLAFFGPYETFCYSDNDIVALCNWTQLFDRLGDHDLLHADEEYTTRGKFNYDQPEVIEETFGRGTLERAITAGHFLARKSPQMLSGMQEALEWMHQNPEPCKAHDQTMLHLAAILGDWDCINLCKAPHNWLSSWAGDYQNPLELVQAGQSGHQISHLHYSGFGEHSFLRAVDPMKLSHLSDPKRNSTMLIELAREKCGWNKASSLWSRAKRRLLKI